MIPMYYERKVSRRMREQRQLDVVLELKGLSEDGRFAGYASVFDVVDSQRDVVLQGAFSRSLRERAGQVKLLWQHAMQEPIGYFTTMFEDAHGLYVEGQLMLELEKAREAYALLKRGVVKGLSIGYSPLHYAMDPDSGVRKLSEVELWEVSLVTFPANEAAQVTVVKCADDDALHMMELQAALMRLERVIHCGG